jgi:hypothetical protein
MSGPVQFNQPKTYPTINAIRDAVADRAYPPNGTENDMSFLKCLAAATVLTAGALGFVGSASASPLMPAHPVTQSGDLVTQAQYYGPPRYERRRYRPVRRTVCNTVVRSVRTPSGVWVRRPVRTCRTVYR